MATRLVCVALLAVSILGLANGESWMDYARGIGWDDSPPANCPHENVYTHVCSSLRKSVSTCVNISRCEGIVGEERISDHLGEDKCEMAEMFIEDFCRLCVTKTNCTVYTCEKYCCDGWTADEFGRCVNNSGEIDCENGGTMLYPAYMGDDYECFCPRNFSGRHCENPECRCENGMCMAHNGMAVCECWSGFTGEHCETPLCSMQCENGGSCITDGTTQYCVCPQWAAGKYCEHFHINDDECPRPVSNGTSWCSQECEDNDDCYGNEHCCSDGCSMYCKRPNPTTCDYEGLRWSVGAVFKPTDCKTCTCTSTGHIGCVTEACSSRLCISGSIPSEYKPGECCNTCPSIYEEQNSGPVFSHCPSYLEVEVGRYSNVAALTAVDRRKFNAHDYRGNYLKPTFSETTYTHCECIYREEKKNTHDVTATVTDDWGKKAVCNFAVQVKDQYPPEISCQEDVYVFADQLVEIRNPDIVDNVGVVNSIFRSSTIDVKVGQHHYPVGNHGVKFLAWDYDNNIATCIFKVSVSSRDTPPEDLPLGLRQKSRKNDDLPLVAIVAPIAGALVIIIFATCIIVMIRRRREPRRANQGAQTATIANSRAPRTLRPMDRFDNMIYTVSGTPDMTLPAYTPPSNPPPYSVKEGGEYSYITPPVYDDIAQSKYTEDSNGYATLDVATSDRKE